MECIYIPENNVVKWAWKDPENDFVSRFDLPKCWGRCKIKPPVIEDTRKNWTREVKLTNLSLKTPK